MSAKADIRSISEPSVPVSKAIRSGFRSAKAPGAAGALNLQKRGFNQYRETTGPPKR
jgi:hypothetical protein